MIAYFSSTQHVRLARYQSAIYILPDNESLRRPTHNIIYTHIYSYIEIQRVFIKTKRKKSKSLHAYMAIYTKER